MSKDVRALACEVAHVPLIKVVISLREKIFPAPMQRLSVLNDVTFLARHEPQIFTNFIPTKGYNKINKITTQKVYQTLEHPYLQLRPLLV